MGETSMTGRRTRAWLPLALAMMAGVWFAGTGIAQSGLSTPASPAAGRPTQSASTQGASSTSPYSEVTLLSDYATLAPGQKFTLAFRQKLEPGWHSYWRNPGDSGEATRIQWTIPFGYVIGPIQWPLPERQKVADLVNYGYAGRATLLMTGEVPASARPGTRADLRATAAWLVCSDICIPESAELRLDLPIAERPVEDPGGSAAIAAARASLPAPANDIRAAIATTLKGARLAVASAELAAAAKTRALTSLWFYPFDNDAITHAAPQPASFGARGVSLDLTVAQAPDRTPGRIAAGSLAGLLVFEINGTRKGVEITAIRATDARDPAFAGTADQPLTLASAGTGPEAGPPAAGGANAIGLFAALGFAFLAGLILNLMPCVFPVLFIKALSFAKGGAESAARIRRNGIFYALGVMTTFAGLGLSLAALSGSGHAIGWGYQLQSPLLIALLMLLMTAIGLNLFGFFEISGRFQNFGSSLAGKDGSMGAFFTGALTVLVASPCLAPGMGAALGFALASPPLEALLVFLVLGLGLALPFTALSFFPGLGALLPRPGPWMERLKQFFAFPMFLTAIWLLWVLAQQTGADGLAGALAAILALVFAIWLLKAPPKGMGLWVTGGLAALSLVAGGAMLAPLTQNGAGTARSPPDAGQSAAAPMLRTAHVPAEAWSPARLEALMAAGRPVFVDFTAAWCVTCRVNTANSIDRPAVARTFERMNAVLLVADWTNRDPAIAAELARFNRPGVPLYLVYQPKAPNSPKVLPQLLSEKMVIAAIEGA